MAGITVDSHMRMVACACACTGAALYPGVCAALNPDVCAALYPDVCTALYPGVWAALDPDVCAALYPGVCAALNPGVRAALDPDVCAALNPDVCAALYPDVCAALNTGAALNPGVCAACRRTSLSVTTPRRCWLCGSGTRMSCGCWTRRATSTLWWVGGCTAGGAEAVAGVRQGVQQVPYGGWEGAAAGEEAAAVAGFAVCPWQGRQ